MNRKDDHIYHALKQKHLDNDFDCVRFIPMILPNLSFDEIDLKTTFANQTFKYPIYINAMTGGSDQAYDINQKLATIAKVFGLPIATGSLSIALRDPQTIKSFKVIRETIGNGFVIANISVSKTVEEARKAIEMVSADALQIHLNAPQEMIMPEGERDFRSWSHNLEQLIKSIDIPVIVKDVGIGMSYQSMTTLKNLGAKTIDVSGKGGTNFIDIENQRRDIPLSAFSHYGFSTVESLLEAKSLKNVTILASGGIRNPFDVVKALALGAQAVGLSRYFLELVMTHDMDDVLKITQIFLEDIKKIMTVLGCKDLQALKEKPLIFDQKILTFMTQQKNM